MCDIQPTVTSSLPSLATIRDTDSFDLPPLPDADDDLNNSLSKLSTTEIIETNILTCMEIKEDLEEHLLLSQETTNEKKEVNSTNSTRQEIETEIPINGDDTLQDSMKDDVITTEITQVDLIQNPQTNDSIQKVVEKEASQDLKKDCHENGFLGMIQVQVDSEENLQTSPEMLNKTANHEGIDQEIDESPSLQSSTEFESPSLQPLKSILKTSSLSRSANRVNLGEMEDNENKSAKRLIRRNTKFIRPEDFEEEEFSGQILKKPVTHSASTSRLITSSSKNISKSATLKVHSSDNLKAWRILGEEPPIDNAQLVPRPRSNSVCLTHLDVSKEKKKTTPSSVKKSKEGCLIA
eukprot:TRINITY_DN4733_c0_g1_i1.p1 TRINITY_DN4733_c0_g1~~TRINITY_DN4733_c0_g1_i1.p1  ORF type:complete len:351 (+),score=68.07 TRINITY_DN4733_c0_g1_i1:67-1119(+)